jgi:hypothetical protein
MKTFVMIAMLLLVLVVSHLLTAPPQLGSPVVHQGFPDGSAGMGAGEQHFIGACDENNVLRLFSGDGQGAPKDLLDLNPLLGFKPKEDGTYRECDLEGAARIGDRVYWIGSHGTNTEGKERKERQVLFATEIGGSGAETKLKFVGKPCKELVAALGKLEKYGLAEAAKKAPEDGGLNIESICAQGDTLLIGFRGPVTAEGALVVPLTNPQAVIDKGAAPVFGTPFTLDLGGRGVRDMAPWNGQFLIVGGDYKDSGKAPALYLWSGDPKSNPKTLHVFEKLNPEGLNPEGLVVHGDGKKAIVRVLSDDGGENFRSVTVKIGGE